MKLSSVQEHVIHQMKNGWELGISSGIKSYCWLQEGKVGHGGNVENVSWKTIFALHARGLIDWTYKFPTAVAYLTEKGKQL